MTASKERKKGPLGGVDFDLVLTAQDIGNYKPSLNDFRHFLEKVNELGLQKVEVLHTGQACEYLWRSVANCFI